MAIASLVLTGAEAGLNSIISRPGPMQRRPDQVANFSTDDGLWGRASIVRGVVRVTAINLFTQDGAAFMLTDGAFTDFDGVLLAIGNKVLDPLVQRIAICMTGFSMGDLNAESLVAAGKCRGRGEHQGS